MASDLSAFVDARVGPRPGGDGQAHPVELDHLLGPRRTEIPLFVKHVIKRQQALVLLEKNLSAIDQHGGIDGGLSRPGSGE